VLLTIVGLLGLFLFAHELNSAISISVLNAQAFAERAEGRHESFVDAAQEFEARDAREGEHSFAGFPRPQRPPASRFGPPGPPPSPPRGSARPPEIAVVDGVVRHGLTMRARYDGSRFGYAIATLFGVRVVPPVPFMDGVIFFGPDPALFQNVVLGLLGALLLASVAVGALAYTIGRYITQQAIQPLVDVTEALQRFAARDFRSQSIALAGKSDFDVLAHAYNAASEQVSAAFAEREAAEAQMRQFVADAGHELRTPLTIVLGYIDLLRRRVSASDERSKFIFTSIAAEGRRMRTLVDNLVLLARLEGDEARLIEPFDVTELIAEIVELRRGLAPGVAFVVDTPVAALAIADRRDVYEAVANIVDNAIKYAPGSPIAITTSMPNDASVEIAIADEGPGIPPEDRDAIFERFYRGALRGEVEGSGLGLAIAKRAVEKAGGTLRLDTAVERGTRFTIVLRAERAQPVSEETPSLRPMSTISRMRG
jgi:two-component system OmpR family sensor kinase